MLAPPDHKSLRLITCGDAETLKGDMDAQAPGIAELVVIGMVIGGGEHEEAEGSSP